MYWNWLTFTLLIVGIIFIIPGVLLAFGDGEGAAILFVIAALCGLGAFVNGYNHEVSINNKKVEVVLESQGFAVAEVSTTDHTATIQFGACSRKFHLVKQSGVWLLLADQPNGERRVFRRSLIGKTGEACKEAIG